MRQQDKIKSIAINLQKQEDVSYAFAYLNGHTDIHINSKQTIMTTHNSTIVRI